MRSEEIPYHLKGKLPQVTLRSTIAGLVIGTIILISNFQFGLQTGWVSMMSLPSALLGFAIFKSLQPSLGYKFTDVENVFVQSVSVAVATGPLAYGFVGIIPAIEKLMTNEESGYTSGVDLSPIWKLIVWSLGLAFFGVFFAIPLRHEFIIKEKLPFPSGSACATLISVFHGTKVRVDGPIEKANTNISNTNNDNNDIINNSHNDDENDDINNTNPTNKNSNSINNINDDNLQGVGIFDQHSIKDDINSTNSLTIIESQDILELQNIQSYTNNIHMLLYTSTVSAIYTIITYFIPQIRTLSIFGNYLSDAYLLNFTPSPAYLGQGIIMGLETTSSMLFGMILGWCFLSPLAKNKGWAPGAVDDWKDGAEGWIMWISLSIMICDSIVSFIIMTIKSLKSLHQSYISNSASVQAADEFSSLIENQNQFLQETGDISSYSSTESTIPPSSFASIKPTPHSSPIPSKTSSEFYDENADDSPTSIPSYIPVIGLIISTPLLLIATRLTFGTIIPYYIILLTIPLSLVLSLLGVKSLGETDLNPVSGIGKLSQLLTSLIVPQGTPGAILINLITGAISEATTQQAGDLMQDLKTGHLLGASPRAQFIAQIIGSVWGVLMSAIVYRLYDKMYEIPGKLFKIPTAVIWIDCARLVNGHGLPPKVWEFSIFFGILFGVISFIKGIWGKGYKWMRFLPSGVAVGIGIYNVPSFTLARFVGGVVSYIWMNKKGEDKGYKVSLIIFSSGLVLGEGLFSVFNMLLTSLGVPHL